MESSKHHPHRDEEEDEEEGKRKTRRELRISEISPVCRILLIIRTRYLFTLEHTHTQVLGNFLGGKSEMSSELAATLKGRKLFRTIPAFAKHGYAEDSSKRIWSQVAKSGHRLRRMY